MEMKKLLVLFLMFLIGHAGIAFASEKRVALVIGNDAYQGVTKLEKAVNDARAMGEALGKVGFEVLSYSNLDRRGMNQAIGLFTDKISGGGVGVFFFAGHGVQFSGNNFLLPVDIKVKDEQDLVDEAIDMQRVLERLTLAKAKLSVLVIDACRDNPFKKTHGRSIGGATRGLAVPQAPSGTMVVYSAGIGQQALDKLSDSDSSPNGLFTREFIPAITTPGLRIDEAVKKVRSSVIAKAKGVGHEQNPAIYDQTDGDFYFIGSSAKPTNSSAPVAVTPQQTSQRVDPMAVEMSFWDSVRSSSDAEDFQEYLRQYPNGKFAGLANNRLRALSQQTLKTPQKSAQNGNALELFEKVKSGDGAALSALRRLAEKGDAMAQGSLGRLYANGWGVTKDEKEAIKWIRKSAAQGQAEGQYSLGRFYENGRGGVSKDESEAMKWYRKAAEQGLDRGQNRLGVFYETGRGVAKNETEAVKWYRKAAEQEYASAQYNLGRMYKEGLGVPKDEAESLKWYRKAAEKGHIQATEALASADSAVTRTSPSSSQEPSPKEFCADRPNFISRGICERRECAKPRNAKDPYCEQFAVPQS